MLEFPAFRALVGRSLALDLSPARPDSLLADLQIDSLCMIEILALFDDHGITLPDALVPELRTMGDLHHYFTVLGPASTDAASSTGQTITVQVARA